MVESQDLLFFASAKLGGHFKVPSHALAAVSLPDWQLCLYLPHICGHGLEKPALQAKFKPLAGKFDLQVRDSYPKPI